MNKKKIDKLIAASYRNGFLDRKIVGKIASLISRADLRKYISGLKLAEKKRCLIVSSPINNLDIKKFEKLFPSKRIVFERDSSLMLGIKLVDNDVVYEFTLRNSLNKILTYIEQNYD